MFVAVVRWTMVLPVAMILALVVLALMGQSHGATTPLAQAYAVHAPLFFAGVVFVLSGAIVAPNRLLAATWLSAFATFLTVAGLFAASSTVGATDIAQMVLRLFASLIGVAFSFWFVFRWNQTKRIA